MKRQINIWRQNLKEEVFPMKSQSMQDLVKKIFSDEKTKAQFVSDPESVLSEYNLTEPEKKAMMGTYFKLGLVTGDSRQLEAEVGPMGLWV
jgi:hypothetical protein